MKNLLIIQDITTNKITYYHLLLFLVLLPFDRFYSQIILISFALHTLIHLERNRLQNVFNKTVIILTAVYLLGIAAILYSPDKNQGWKDAEKQLAILLFPLLFAMNSLEIKKYKLQLLIVFALTCTITILYLFVDALRIMQYYHLPISSLFTRAFMNHNFSSAIDIHATYLAMYAGISVITFLYLFLNEKSPRQRFLYGLGIFILAAGLLQLASRAVFFALMLVINIALPFFTLQGKKRIKILLITSLISIVVILSIYYVGSFKKRYLMELKNDLTQASNNNEVLEPRVIRWRAALELVKHSPIIGYGSGSETELLKEVYFEKKLYNSYLTELNAHNQYLSFLIKTGIIGLALYLFVLLFGFYYAIRTKDILFLSFLILVTIVSISENILDVNKGIFFYSFFIPLFLLAERSDVRPGNSAK